MVCTKCGMEMYVNESRERNNVRWRCYTCKTCGNKIGTEEQLTDYVLVRKMITHIEGDKYGRGRKVKHDAL